MIWAISIITGIALVILIAILREHHDERTYADLYLLEEMRGTVSAATQFFAAFPRKDVQAIAAISKFASVLENLRRRHRLSGSAFVLRQLCELGDKTTSDRINSAKLLSEAASLLAKIDYDRWARNILVAAGNMRERATPKGLTTSVGASNFQPAIQQHAAAYRFVEQGEGPRAGYLWTVVAEGTAKIATQRA